MVERFPALEACADIVHGFVGRQRGVPVDDKKDEVMPRLRPMWRKIIADCCDGLPVTTAEQVHGVEIAVVDHDSAGSDLSGVDALVTNQTGIVLGIVVADCCAVYLVDTKNDAIGLCHAGKKGAEGNIVGKTLALMTEQFGSDPRDISAQLSPCIRPPHYEVDIPSIILGQLQTAGVPINSCHDCRTCTASNPENYYSYRRELGKTGRMMAFLMHRS